MATISKVCGKIKLYYRYGCRRLGLSSYQIHQIYLPEQNLVYIPIPKNACTSIKQALHEIEFGYLFNANLLEFNDYQEIHEYYQLRPHAFTGVNRLKRKTNVTRFAVIRDPVERLISCYRNRVLDKTISQQS